VIDDSTYGGYVARHERPPAFAGSDGQAYSVALLVDDEPDTGGRYGGAFLFVRWAEGGDLPTGHVETEYLAFGQTRDEAERRLAAMSLLEVKAQLDRALATRTGSTDW
jgi:hypothetical protein